MIYYHFSKIIKGPRTSLQSQALSQKHVKNVCSTQRANIRPNQNFDSTYDSKETTIIKLPLCSNACDDFTDLEIFESHRDTKI